MKKVLMGGTSPTEPTPKQEPKPQSGETDHSGHHPPGEEK